jgi:hypothetical protein
LLGAAGVTADELILFLAWLGLVLWAAALVSFINHKNRLAAILNAIVALPFLIAPLRELLEWRSDPGAYVRQYGAGALRQLPLDAVMLGLSVLALLGCALLYRGRRRLWATLPFLLNGVWLVFLFYLAYFFHIQF